MIRKAITRHFIQCCGNKYFLCFFLPLQLMLQCMTYLTPRKLKKNRASLVCLSLSHNQGHLGCYMVAHLKMFFKSIIVETSVIQLTSPLVCEASRDPMASSVGWRTETLWKSEGAPGILPVTQVGAHSCCQKLIIYFRSGRLWQGFTFWKELGNSVTSGYVADVIISRATELQVSGICPKSFSE